MATVLCVTSDSSLQPLVAAALPEAGLEVIVVASGQEALRALRRLAVDALVLDTVTGDVGVDELCRALRAEEAWEPIPIVFLAGPEGRWLPGWLPLREGKDGLVSKPLTVTAIRREVDRVLAGTPASGTMRLAEGVELERSGQEARGSQGTVSLTPTEFRLLSYLAERPTAIVSTAELLEKVWEFYPGTGSSELVRSHIRNVRAKLKQVTGGRELIRTVPRRGYRLA